jgi:hypothetical protein
LSYRCWKSRHIRGPVRTLPLLDYARIELDNTHKLLLQIDRRFTILAQTRTHKCEVVYYCFPAAVLLNYQDEAPIDKCNLQLLTCGHLPSRNRSKASLEKAPNFLSLLSRSLLQTEVILNRFALKSRQEILRALCFVFLHPEVELCFSVSLICAHRQPKRVSVHLILEHG